MRFTDPQSGELFLPTSALLPEHGKENAGANMGRLTTFAILLAGSLAIRQGPAQEPPDRKTDQNHWKMVEKAEASVAQARKRVEKDPNRPIYHLQPPALWSNDPNGPICYGGEYHLFFQHNPYGDNWVHKHWCHFMYKVLFH